MKRALIIMAVAMAAMTLVFGVANAADRGRKTTYKVEIFLDKENPPVGDNTITIKVKDKTGTPVKGLKVSIRYTMPPMQGMPPMDYKADAALEGEDYKAKVNFSMAGSWKIEVKVGTGYDTETHSATVDVR